MGSAVGNGSALSVSHVHCSSHVSQRLFVQGTQKQNKMNDNLLYGCMSKRLWEQSEHKPPLKRGALVRVYLLASIALALAPMWLLIGPAADRRLTFILLAR